MAQASYSASARRGIQAAASAVVEYKSDQHRMAL